MAELVITKDELKDKGTMKLAWKLRISSLEPYNEQEIYLDASTNQVIRDIPLISDGNISISAQTQYSGTKTLTGDSFSGGYRLRETRNSVNVTTLNNQHYTATTSAIDFTNSSTGLVSKVDGHLE